MYYSLSWSLGEYDQSKARLHRPGQKKSVTFVHLVATGTVDEKVMAALESKREVIKEASVKGMPSELIFLTNDVLMLRRPPIQLLKIRLKKDYQ